jgi:20S proteasome alpha/beta subunit
MTCQNYFPKKGITRLEVIQMISQALTSAVSNLGSGTDVAVIVDVSRGVEGMDDQNLL